MATVGVGPTVVYAEMTAWSYVYVVPDWVKIVCPTGPKPGPSPGAAELEAEVGLLVFDFTFETKAGEVGNVVKVPSTLIVPDVADTGMENVWPDIIRGGAPGVRAAEAPAADRLIGFPVNGMPSIVYTEGPLDLDDAEEGALVIAARVDKVAIVPSTLTRFPVAEAGIEKV